MTGQGGIILTTFGSILLGLASFSIASISDDASQAIPDDLASIGRAAMLIGGIMSTVTGVVLQVFKRPTYAQLLRENQESDERAGQAAASLEDALESLLRRIAEHCGLRSAHQRASIYCVVNDRFVLLARNSVNSRLALRGRDSYPNDQGVIGQAWEVGQSTRRDWPADRDQWNAVQVHSENMPADVVRGLRMQARSVMATRLSHGSDNIGVLVLESEQPRGVLQRHIDRAQTSLLLDSATEIMVSAHPLFPSVAKRLAADS